MSERKRRFFSGPSLEAALVSAASEYGLTPEEVSYRTVEKRHGFLKVRRNVVIQVDPDAPKKTDQPDKAAVAEKTARPTAAESRRAEPVEPEPAEPEPDTSESLAAEPPDEPGEPESGGAREDSDARPPLRPRTRGEHRATAEPAPDRRGGEERSEKRERGRGRGRGQGRKQDPDRERRDEATEREPERAPTRALARPKRKPRELQPIEERLERAQGELGDAALEASEWLLDLVDLDADPSVYEGEDRLEVELRGPDRDLLTDDDGKVLSALEHLIPRVMRGVCGDTHPVRVDSENFQERREDRLREQAWETADEVRTAGQAKILEAMDPADRRIVHLAISDDPEVTTRSLGEGFFKRVKVLPK